MENIQPIILQDYPMEEIYSAIHRPPWLKYQIVQTRGGCCGHNVSRARPWNLQRASTGAGYTKQTDLPSLSAPAIILGSHWLSGSFHPTYGPWQHYPPKNFLAKGLAVACCSSDAGLPRPVLYFFLAICPFQ